MKSLVLKDLYNLKRNARSLILVLTFVAVCQIPSIGAEGFLACCTIICTMQTVSTFSFDEHYNWKRYALIMPISRKELVGGKFLILAIVAAAGVAVGFVFGLVGTAVLGGVWQASIPVLLATGLVTFCAALMIGGTVIPLIFRFGAEKGRLLLILAALIPTGLVAGAAWLLNRFGVEISPAMLFIGAPVLALPWCYGMYRISCGIFEKQEL